MSPAYHDGTNWIEAEDRPLLIAPGAWIRSAGLSYAGFGGSRGQALNFPDAATETAFANLPVPIGWAVVKVSILWTIGATGAAGQVARFTLNTGSFGDTDNTNVADTTVTTEPTAPAQDTLKETVLGSAVAVTSGKMLRIRVAREGAHANDTLAGPALVCLVKIERVR